MTSIPNNYIEKSRFRSIGLKWLIVIGLIVCFILYGLIVWLSKLGGFDAKFDSPIMWVLLVLALALSCYFHEKIHQRVFRKYGIQTRIQWYNLENRLSPGQACTRNGAIHAIISPLILLGIFGLTILVLAWGNGIFAYAALFLLANVGLAFSDVEQFVWLRKHPKDYLFGYDGKDLVMYGPQLASESTQ